MNSSSVTTSQSLFKVVDAIFPVRFFANASFHIVELDVLIKVEEPLCLTEKLGRRAGRELVAVTVDTVSVGWVPAFAGMTKRG